MPSANLSSQNATKKYWLLLVPIVAFLALVLLMKISGSGQTIEPPQFAKVHTVNVMPIEWHEQYVHQKLVIGRVEAKQTAAIGFDLAGLVVDLHADEGQKVNKGQVLANLEQLRLNAQMNELSAVLRRAESEAVLAELSLERVVELVEKKLESSQRLDETREGVVAANAFVDEIIARQKTLKVELSKTKLHAPFDGTIVSRLVDQGTVVSAGQILFNVQQDSSLEVRFSLPTDYAKALTIGQSISLLANDNLISGTVKSVSHIRRLDTRTIDVIISLLDRNSDLLPGDIVNLSMHNDIDASGFWVPRKSLVSGVRGLWSLFVVEQTEEGSHLVAKLVEMIYADDKDVFVRGALVNGQQVVVDGVHRLVPGQNVSTNLQVGIRVYSSGGQF